MEKIKIMEEQFATYEIASKLRGLGFDEPCMAYWKELPDKEPILLSEFVFDNSRSVHYTQSNGNEISAPLWQQVIDWFREKYNIHIHISRIYQYYKTPRLFEGWCVYIDNGKDNSNLECNAFFMRNFYQYYREAREKAILEVIKIIEDRYGRE